MQKSNHPRPSFQLQAIESGNAIIANRIGLEIIKIATKRFQFCIQTNLKMANKYLNVMINSQIVLR